MTKVGLNTGIVLALLAAINQNAGASITLSTPDAASTSILMGVACVGLTTVRRFIRWGNAGCWRRV